MSLILTTRASKDEILEMYLNDMTARPARLVRDRRRRRGGAAVLRQGRQQPDAGRSGDDRRRHPVAVGAVAVQQPGPLPGAPQRRAAGDGRRRLRHRRTPPTARSTSRWPSSQRALEAEAPYFVDFVGQTLAEQYPGLDHDDDAGGRRLHDARPAPAAARAGRGARRPDPGRRAAVASASAARPRRR